MDQLTIEEQMKRQEEMLMKRNPNLMKNKPPSAKINQGTQYFDSTQMEKKKKPKYDDFE